MQLVMHGSLPCNAPIAYFEISSLQPWLCLTSVNGIFLFASIYAYVLENNWQKVCIRSRRSWPESVFADCRISCTASYTNPSSTISENLPQNL